MPAKVRVVGFDDVRLRRLPARVLDNDQPCRENAEVAFRTMQKRIQIPTIPPRTLTVAPRLVVHQSCGTYLR